jgi:hypothetical protein
MAMVFLGARIARHRLIVNDIYRLRFEIFHISRAHTFIQAGW